MSSKGKRGTRICSHITDFWVRAATSVRSSITSPSACQYIDAGKSQQNRHGPFLLCSHQRFYTFYAFNRINSMFFSLPKCTVLFLETEIISSTTFKMSTCDIAIIVMINKDSHLIHCFSFQHMYRDLLASFQLAHVSAQWMPASKMDLKWELYTSCLKAQRQDSPILQ